MTRQISRFSIFCIVAAILSAIYLLVYRFVLADIAAANYDLFCPKNVILSAAVFVFLYRCHCISYQRSVAQKPACSTAYDAPAAANPVFGILFGICPVKPLRKPSNISGSDIKPDGQSVLLFSGSNSVFVWNFKISKDSPEALNFGGIFLFCTDFLFSLSHPFAQSTRKIFYKKQKVLDLN